MANDEGLSEPDELEYEGQIPAKAVVEQEALAIWRTAWADDAQLRQRVRPENPQGEAPPLPVAFDLRQGVDPISVTLIVMAATAGISVGKTVAMDIWKKILLPKLERKWGEKSVRPVAPRRRKS